MLVCIYNVETGFAVLTKITKWGHSRALRIPKALAEEAGLDFGQAVDLQVVDGEIRIRRSRKRKRYDLDKMLESVPDNFESEDWGLGPPVGNEI